MIWSYCSGVGAVQVVRALTTYKCMWHHILDLSRDFYVSTTVTLVMVHRVKKVISFVTVLLCVCSVCVCVCGVCAPVFF